jgi:hypothetical protein
MMIEIAMMFETDHRVDPDAPHFASLRRGILLQRPIGGIDALLLGFLGRLPDEQIGRDRHPPGPRPASSERCHPTGWWEPTDFQGFEPRHLDDE